MRTRTPHGEGRVTEAARIQPGDTVITGNGSHASVAHVVKSTCLPYSRPLVNINGAFFTHYHPLHIEGKWVFPIDIKAAEKSEVDMLVNLELEDDPGVDHTVIVNDVVCATLGNKEVSPELTSRRPDLDSAFGTGTDGGDALDMRIYNWCMSLLCHIWCKLS